MMSTDVPGLWPHQRGATEAAVAHLACSERGLIVMACGTGKTRTGAEVTRRLAPGGKVLVVVPTQELLAQTCRDYAAFLGAGVGRIGAVCAERAATIEANEARGEMAGLHAGVSTDPPKVASWLRAPGRVTIFTTYASLPVVSAAHRIPRTPGWDVAVIDEAHRAAGLAGRAWSAINDDTAIPVARRLYMTATPRILAPASRDDVVSMDDEKVFGREVFRVSFAEAISRGLLADYQIAVVVVDSAEVAQLAAGEQIVSSSGTAVPARMLAAQLGLLKAARQYDLRRIITYHHRVAGARRFAQTLLNAADLLPATERPRLIRAASVDGSMRPGDRREALRHLKAPGDRVVVVTNSRVLSEGVDVPDLDAVMFADPRDSGTDVVQAVGRALRRGSRESKTATIIIPVVLDQAEFTAVTLDSSEYATVWRVVRALRAHDERMASWLDQARVSRARIGPDAIPESPDWLTVTGTPVGPSFAAALQVHIVTAGTSPWLDGYAHAADFHAAHGHLNLPVAHVASDGYPLGRWLHGQRQERKRGALAAERVARLDAIAMVWEVFEGPWLDGLARLRAYRTAFGHLDIPEPHLDSDGFALGKWASQLRGRRTAGTLSAEKIAILDDLGLPWSARDHRWALGLKAATSYHAAHGHLAVPRGYATADGFRLDSWVRIQRRKLGEGTLDARQAAALEALGVQPGTDPRWDKGLQVATEYHATHGHINVPGSHLASNGFDLAAWIQDKRHQYRRGKLPPDRAASLERLGINWNPRGSAWDDGLRALNEFKAVHRHTDVPQGHVTPSGYRLGKWWEKQRIARIRGNLSPDREAALEGLSVQWDTPKDRTRTAMIAALRSYVAENGHADVPRAHVTSGGLKLGAWLATTRQLVRAGRAPHPDTLAALRECGIPWATTSPAAPGPAAPCAAPGDDGPQADQRQNTRGKGKRSLCLLQHIPRPGRSARPFPASKPRRIRSDSTSALDRPDWPGPGGHHATAQGTGTRPRGPAQGRWHAAG